MNKKDNSVLNEMLVNAIDKLDLEVEILNESVINKLISLGEEIKKKSMTSNYILNEDDYSLLLLLSYHLDINIISSKMDISPDYLFNILLTTYEEHNKEKDNE